MNVRRMILIVVVLLGLTGLAVAVAAPMVLGAANPGGPVDSGRGAVAGY